MPYRQTAYLVPSSTLHLLDDLGLLVGGVHVGHIARVQDHTDVLHERLVFDLVVREEEDRALAFSSCLQQQL